MKQNKGFTFIEILVVTTIIGILTMVGATNFKVANQKARDGKRQADLEQIRAALEFYRTDEGVYPSESNILENGIRSVSRDYTYMYPVPSDPTAGRQYYYYSDGIGYSLCAALEVGSGDECTAVGAYCGAECNYQVSNPD